MSTKWLSKIIITLLCLAAVAILVINRLYPKFVHEQNEKGEKAKQGSIYVEDLLREKEALEVKWKAEQEWWEQRLKSMRADYEQIMREFDASVVLSPTKKIEAWNRFLEAYKDDNPVSKEDERMRQNAQGRLDYWQKRVQ